jgi:ABC-type bacteriocin/lantibiotic exporter with double-glycine peptidase domain
MKFPQGSTLVVALILAAITFFVFNTVTSITSIIAALAVLIAVAISPMLAELMENAIASSAQVKTLYVGNLPYKANESTVKALFSEHAKVHSVRLMKDKHTGKRRGFGFVEISASAMEDTIVALNDSEFQQRTLKVREAKERPAKEN